MKRIILVGLTCTVVAFCAACSARNNTGYRVNIGSQAVEEGFGGGYGPHAIPGAFNSRFPG